MIAAIMAVTVAMNAMMVPAVAEDKFVPTKDGVYTTTEVKVYQVGTNNSIIDTMSSYNGAFAGEMDLVVNGEWTDLTLYICNPSMTVGGLEAGVFIDPYIIYDGKQYDGDLTSIGCSDPNAANKLYTQDSGIMFGVKAGGYYLSDTIEFTIPTAALAAERVLFSGIATGFTNYPRQEAMLDMTFVAVELASDETSQAMEVTAIIPANVATYTVTIPDKTDLGELSTVADTTVEYTVEVVTTFVDKTITVQTTDVILTDETGDVSLTLANTFGEKGVETFTESGSAKGTLTATVGDVVAAVTNDAQSLSGSVLFTITAA